MKRLALIFAVVLIVFAGPAHADTLDFTWESQAWVRTNESPTQFTVSGPFTLSGRGSVTVQDVLTGGTAGRTLEFDRGYGGTLMATGDGTYNGPMTFPTSVEPRRGLAVLSPTSDGFTVTVNRAASGPDPGAAFFGIATEPNAAGQPSATAGEPGVWLVVAAGLVVAARLRRRRRRP